MSRRGTKRRSYRLPGGCKKLGPVKKTKPTPIKKRSVLLEFPVNGRICASHVELRNEKGIRIAVFRLTDAMELARSRRQDIVQVDGRKCPPVCILTDYGKFRWLAMSGRLPKEWFSNDGPSH